MYLRKSNICSHKLDLCEKQTTVSHSSTESEVCFFGCWFANEQTSPLLILWDVVIEVAHSSKNTESPTQHVQGNLSRNSNSKVKKRKTEMLINCQMWITLSQTQVLLDVKHSFYF